MIHYMAHEIVGTSRNDGFDGFSLCLDALGDYLICCESGICGEFCVALHFILWM